MTFEEVAKLGEEIDAATDASNIATLQSLEERAALLCADESSQHASYVWYFRSNIHSAIQDIHDRRSWQWRQPDRERQILYLRRALQHSTFLRLDPVMKASMLVNLGNSLSSFGRGLEAIELYDLALALVPAYAMALGNRGEAMQALLPSIPDSGHARLLAAYAHQYLQATQADNANWENGQPFCKPYYKELADRIASKIDPEITRSENPLDRFSLGRGEDERAYRHWALRNNLFLNPLNVLGTHSIAAQDRMNLPSYISPAGDPPEFIAWFNQMKQEFIVARWFLYEGTRQRKQHYADRGVFLTNTLDYPVFSLQTEKLRTAFRVAYSLLDKVAGFINSYYKLGMKAKRIDLRSIWNTKKDDLRPEFRDKENLALRGLYWLALEIIGEGSAYQDSIAPEASELKRLRNLLEHRSLILREIARPNPMGAVETMTLAEFETHTLRIVKLARSALMYLAFSMRIEEEARNPRGAFVPGIALPLL